MYRRLAPDNGRHKSLRISWYGLISGAVAKLFRPLQIKHFRLGPEFFEQAGGAPALR